MLYKVYLFFISIFLVNCSFAQAQQNFNSVEVSPFLGVQMFSVKPNLMKGNFFGGEAVYHLNMGNNTADWVHMMRVKDISFAFSYRRMDGVYLINQPNSTGFLGNSYGLTSRLNIFLTKLGKTDLMLVPGFGFTYTTESFYTDDNPLVGSHVNFSAQAGLKLVRPLSATTRLQVGFDIYHYSNAAFKLPNNGVNSLNASIGIDHDIDKAGPGPAKNIFKHYNKNSFEFGVNIGRRGLVQSGDGLYGQGLANQRTATSRLVQSGLTAAYNYRLNSLFSLKVATDAVFYYTPYNVDDFYHTFQERGTSFNRWRIGESLGTDIWLGRVAFEINYGHYIHYASYYNENWYWTFGGKYFVTPWMAVEVKQYLHGTEANFAGFGVLFKVY